MEDLYKILNISKDSTKSQIKKAYRELVLTAHPDKGGDEELFKKINNAYSILSDDTKRKNYDKYGSVDNDYIDDIFSRFGNFNQPNITKGVDLRIQMNLTYMDVLNGVVKSIKLNRKHICGVCRGTGGEEVDSCGSCNGSGKKVHVQNTIFGQVRGVYSCQDCNGFGYSIRKECGSCVGGYILKEDIVQIEIPPGVETGMQLRQPGYGNHIRNGVPGDLIIVLNIEDLYSFVRQNNNVISSFTISIPEAILGCSKVVKGIDGKDLQVNIEPGVSSGQKYRFKNEGLPDFNYRVRGDLIYQVDINIPKSITKQEEDIIRKLSESESFKTSL